MIIITITFTGVRVVPLTFIIAIVRAGSKLCLLFDVMSFLISFFYGLTVLVLDELGKSWLEILNDVCLTKPLLACT